MEVQTFNDIRKIVRTFTSVIGDITDLGITEIVLALSKEQHRRAMKDEHYSNPNRKKGIRTHISS